MTSVLPGRLPAHERRQAIVHAALPVFAKRSYAGATTAEIAREAGVSEPILYRHFPSKRDLYFACLDEAWARLRAAFEETFGEAERAAAEGGAAAVKPAVWAAKVIRRQKVLVPNLWLQASSEAGQDPEIRRFLRAQMEEVHEYLADRIRRGQAIGLISPDRDPDVEAWVTIGGGLLVSLADRLGGVLDEADLVAISAQRQRWLFGAA